MYICNKMLTFRTSLAVYAKIWLKRKPSKYFIYFTYIEFIFFFPKKQVKNAKLSSVKRGGLFWEILFKFSLLDCTFEHQYWWCSYLRWIKSYCEREKRNTYFSLTFPREKKCSNITLQKFEIWDQKSVNTYDIAKLIPICTYVDYGNITPPQRVGWTWAEWAVYARWHLWGRSYYPKWIIFP